jgi:hypothetical protein
MPQQWCLELRSISRMQNKNIEFYHIVVDGGNWTQLRPNHHYGNLTDDHFGVSVDNKCGCLWQSWLRVAVFVAAWL